MVVAGDVHLHMLQQGHMCHVHEQSVSHLQPPTAYLAGGLAATPWRP
jgi:hypothetical protein